MKDPVYSDQPQPARADDPAAVCAQGPRDPGTVIPMKPDKGNPALSAARASDTFTFSCGVSDPAEGAMVSGEVPDEPGESPDTEVGAGGDEVGPRDPGTVIP